MYEFYNKGAIARKVTMNECIVKQKGYFYLG